MELKACLSGTVTFFQLSEDFIQKQYSNAVKRQKQAIQHFSFLSAHMENCQSSWNLINFCGEVHEILKLFFLMVG